MRFLLSTIPLLADVDYSETDIVFTLSGTEEITVPVDLVNDITVEPSEIFFGNIMSADGPIDNVNFFPIMATSTIRDDDGKSRSICTA